MNRLLPLCTLLVACTANTPPTDPAQSFEEGPPLVTLDGKGDALAESIPAYAPLTAQMSLDGDFEVLFAPDDPVNTVEMELISSVVSARAADPRAFTEGANPYRIRYAVYNLRNPRIVDALADAEDQGVDVQVLLDADQLDPAREWNTADEELIARGFEFVADHRDISASEIVSADLIGIAGGGLMHLKTRVFETPSDRVALSGSLNPGDNAVLNEETLHLMRDPVVVGKYVDAYETVLHGERFINRWDPGAPVNVLFTPATTERAVGHVFDWLAEEQEQILLMIFSLRDLTAPGHSRTLVELLGDKVAEGVDVYVITDRKQSDGVDANGNRIMNNDGTEDRLRAAGVTVYEATNLANEFTAMHHKVAVLGRSRIRIITDAANWTFSGLGSATRRARNVESQLFIDSSALDGNRTGRRYLAQWLRVANRYANQNTDNGSPPLAEIWDHFRDRANWPHEDVHFVADETQTEFGESVFVKGDTDDLGHWGDLSSGHELTTDEQTYPTWHSLAPLRMPVGASFEYKFTIHVPAGGSVRWESGENRRGFVQPNALESEGAAHRGTWK